MDKVQLEFVTYTSISIKIIPGCRKIPVDDEIILLRFSEF